MNKAGASIDHDAQLRQWLKWDKKKKRFERQPSPANCNYLAAATNGAVDRQSMRPYDWQAIWPNEIPRTPTTPTQQEA